MSEREATAIDVLVVGPVPEFDRASGSLRFYLMLQMLARRYRVTLLGWTNLEDRRSPRYVNALEEAGITVKLVAQADLNDSLARILGQVGLCVLFEFFGSAEWAWARVRMQRPDLPIVVDSVDVHFLREMRGTRYSKSPRVATEKARRTKKRELGVYRQADLVLTVTENDRAEILAELPNARVTMVPNIHEVQEAVPGLDERRRNSLLFVGGFVHPPNVDAVLFFCREILGMVRQKLGDVEVTIIGDRPPSEIVELGGDGVVIAGWVPEVTPYLDSHRVGIAPLRFGAGMKGKIGQALAAGLPVVTTSVGAEGMDLEDGQTALIADSPEAFADAVVRLCTDRGLHRHLSEGGRSHVRRRWASVVVENRLIEALEGLRGLNAKSLRGRERLAARLRDTYVRSGLSKRMERGRSVMAWYLRGAGRGRR